MWPRERLKGVAMNTCSKTAFLALLLLGLVKGDVQAQTLTAQVHGTVVGQSSAGLSGATVTVKNEETGISKLVLTDAEGRYRLFDLRPGKYQFLVELAGFGKEELSGVVLQGSRAVNFTLRVAANSPGVLPRDVWNQLSEATDTFLPNFMMGFP